MSTYDGPMGMKISIKVETETVPRFHTGKLIYSDSIAVNLEVVEQRRVAPLVFEKATVVYIFPWQRILHMEQVSFDADNV